MWYALASAYRARAKSCALAQLFLRFLLQDAIKAYRFRTVIRQFLFQSIQPSGCFSTGVIFREL
jgi:hypothetical protein